MPAPTALLQKPDQLAEAASVPLPADGASDYCLLERQT